MNLDLYRKLVILDNYGFGGGIMTVTNAKSSAESEKFTLKIRSESGKLFALGCQFPPKSTNFGTLRILSIRITTNLMLEKENYRPKNIYRIFRFAASSAMNKE